MSAKGWLSPPGNSVAVTSVAAVPAPKTFPPSPRSAPPQSGCLRTETVKPPASPGCADSLETAILSRIPDTRVNGAGALRTPNTTNIQFAGIEGEALLIALDLAGFAVSSGAACSSGAVEPSHVLTAMGLSKSEAKSSIRFSLGRTNNQTDVDELLEALAGCVSRLRKISPLHVIHTS